MKLISSILIPIFLSSSLAYGKCNLAEDIKEVEGGYLYTPDCHRLVGQKFIENQEYSLQLKRYEELVLIQDETIQWHKERAEIWRDATYDLEDRVHKLDWANDRNKLLYFGAGVILMLGASWAAGQASK